MTLSVRPLAGRCRWKRDDGGAKASGFKVEGDCVVRAIAIATSKPYREVREELVKRALAHAKQQSHGGYTARRIRRSGGEKGWNAEEVWVPYLESLGWQYIDTDERKVRLRADELPKGRLIVSINCHLVAVIDGVIHDTYDSGGAGRVSVHGYHIKSSATEVVEVGAASLAAKINAAHSAATKAVAEGAMHAIKAGELLLEAKAKVGHGQWAKWQRENLSFSKRTAQVYMQLARLDPQNRNGVADLALRRAVLKIQADERARRILEERPKAIPAARIEPPHWPEPPPVEPPTPEKLAEELIGQLVEAVHQAAEEAGVDVAYMLEVVHRRLSLRLSREREAA
jgi:hypothetical protein